MDPILFMGIENVEDVSNSEEEAPAEKSDCIKNPNRDDKYFSSQSLRYGQNLKIFVKLSNILIKISKI